MSVTAPSAIVGFLTRIDQISVGSNDIRFFVVDQLEQLVDRQALLRDADATEPPYWAHLWTASRVLARLIAERSDWSGKRVIDIGCGLGVPGVIAAMRGANVTAVDLAPEALAMTRANAVLNGCHIDLARCDLRHLAFGARFDVILAADVTYDPYLQRALADFIAAHLAVGGAAWCAESVRNVDVGFRDACHEQELDVLESQVLETDEGRTVPVRVSEVRRR